MSESRVAQFIPWSNGILSIWRAISWPNPYIIHWPNPPFHISWTQIAPNIRLIYHFLPTACFVFPWYHSIWPSNNREPLNIQTIQLFFPAFPQLFGPQPMPCHAPAHWSSPRRPQRPPPAAPLWPFQVLRLGSVCATRRWPRWGPDPRGRPAPDDGFFWDQLEISMTYQLERWNTFWFEDGLKMDWIM